MASPNFEAEQRGEWGECGNLGDVRDTEYELKGVFDRLSTTTSETTIVRHGAEVYCVFRIMRPYRSPRPIEYHGELASEPFSGVQVEMEVDDHKVPSMELVNAFLRAVLDGRIRLRIWHYDCAQVPVNVDLVRQEIYIDQDILYGQYFDCAIAEREDILYRQYFDCAIG